MKSVVFVIGCFLFVSACGDIDPLSQGSDLEETTTVALEEGSFDYGTDLRARAGGLSLSVETAAEFDAQTSFWSLKLNANRPLEEVAVRELEGYSHQVEIVDSYGFVIYLEQEALVRLMLGHPLHLFLSFSSGEQREFGGMLRIRPRLVQPEGSLLIWLEPQIRSVVVGDEVRYRGHVVSASKVESLEISMNDKSDAPESIWLGDGRWMFEWSEADLARVVGSSDSGIVFIGTAGDGGESLVNSRLGVVVEQLGVTTEDPSEIWPGEECDFEVDSCLNLAFRDLQLDTSHCGSACSVLACR